PYLVHLSMRQELLQEYRRRVVPGAHGRVLEIGVGSGINFPFYGDDTTSVIALDPSAKLLSMANAAIDGIKPTIDLIEASAEALPFADASVDTVVSTWTLCSIPDVRRALREVRRVLRANGRFRFVEHGRAPDANFSRWQGRLSPLW